MNPVIPDGTVAPIVDALRQLHAELQLAVERPLDPELRRELKKVAAASHHSLATLETAHQTAQAELAAKQQKADAAAAANRQKIAAQQQKLAPTAEAPPAARPAIDPTLAARLAAELLGRQAVEPADANDGLQTGDVLDGWDWKKPPAGATG
ncbi:hypothetical protein Pla123a_30970 [Posidoniimonas polymericola]|uniref:Uncharacterized protein n=1 Tax=Posidoniimonas polymericola TaxID=2528002 RepID=A0A5C5YL60_9BACT|nr:hypothetical protein [Posidoniimonas polymericola]TWT75587.1 hypothetical protein Pla123a_30970 [Posidoniimonas polymericola]